MTDSDRRMLDEIADVLMDSFPVFFRKVSKEKAHPSGKKFGPSRFVLRAVMMHGPVRMSEMGEHMGISKPYMTALVNQLIHEGLVERVSDPDDRRVVEIKITDAGRNAVSEFTRCTRETIIKNLSPLSSEEISALNDSMKNMRSIISKLDHDATRKHKQYRR